MPTSRTLIPFTIAMLATSAVFAQTSAELAARRLLVERAEAARAAGQHAEALDLASRAGQIQMTPSVRLFIAQEQQQTNHLAEAFGSADQCLRDVETNPSARHRDVIRERCNALHDELRTRIGQLVVQVATPPPADLRIVLAGQPLNPALYNAPMVVTPGDIAVVASAPGRRTWNGWAHVVAGGSATVRVELGLEPIAEAPVVAMPPPVAQTPAPTPSQPERVTAREASSGTTQRTLGWVAAGGAGLMLGGGVVASVLQLNAGAYIEANGCTSPPQGECASRSDTQDTAYTLSLVGYIGGGALAVTSVVLLLTAPSGERRSPSAVRGCGIGPGTAGVACEFAF